MSGNCLIQFRSCDLTSLSFWRSFRFKESHFLLILLVPSHGKACLWLLESQLKVRKQQQCIPFPSTYIPFPRNGLTLGSPGKESAGSLPSLGIGDRPTPVSTCLFLSCSEPGWAFPLDSGLGRGLSVPAMGLLPRPSFPLPFAGWL